MTTLPPINQTTKDLPQGKSSRLVNFAETISKATSLAKDKRRKFEVEMLGKQGFTPGKVEAGTFASILKASQNASEQRQEPLQQGITATREKFGQVSEEQVKTIGTLLEGGFPLSTILNKFDDERQLEIANALHVKQDETFTFNPEEEEILKAYGLEDASQEQKLKFLESGKVEKPKTRTEIREEKTRNIIETAESIIRGARITGRSREDASNLLKEQGLDPKNFKKELDSEYGKEGIGDGLPDLGDL